MSYSWGAPPASVQAGGPPLERPRRPVRPTSARAEVDDQLPVQHRVAAELTPMVDVWQRLLAQHVPDESGCCRTCTQGGTGLRTTPWPCVINGIADLARHRYVAAQQRAAAQPGTAPGPEVCRPCTIRSATRHERAHTQAVDPAGPAQANGRRFRRRILPGAPTQLPAAHPRLDNPAPRQSPACMEVL
jgi:hypothetical protein